MAMLCLESDPKSRADLSFLKAAELAAIRDDLRAEIAESRLPTVALRDRCVWILDGAKNITATRSLCVIAVYEHAGPVLNARCPQAWESLKKDGTTIIWQVATY